jgi:hypothetical protein
MTMHEDDPSDLSPEERQAFAALPRQAPGNDLLEERIVRTLESRGLLRRAAARRRLPAWAIAAAACVLFFAGGFALGKSRSSLGTEWSGEMRIQPSDEATDSKMTTDVTAVTDSSDAGSMKTVVWF